MAPIHKWAGRLPGRPRKERRGSGDSRTSRKDHKSTYVHIYGRRAHLPTKRGHEELENIATTRTWPLGRWRLYAADPTEDRSLGQRTGSIRQHNLPVPKRAKSVLTGELSHSLVLVCNMVVHGFVPLSKIQTRHSRDAFYRSACHSPCPPRLQLGSLSGEEGRSGAKGFRLGGDAMWRV